VNILAALNKADCQLVLGYGAAISFWTARAFSRPLAVNVDGLEWKRAKFAGPVRAFLKYSELVAMSLATAVVADSMRVKEYIDRRYRIRSNYIPYGADHCQRGIQFDSTYLTAKVPKIRPTERLESGRYYLVVARLEPENSIETIVKAFRQLTTTNPLLVVGDFSSGSYSEHIRKVVASDDRIIFVGSVYDRLALDMLRSHCFAYVHGHAVGGTNPALLEAMYLGAPTIAFDSSFNREVGGDTIDYFEDEKSLLGCLAQRERGASDARSLAAAAARRIDSLYSWDSVTRDYIELFENLAVKPARRRIGGVHS
jgi:rhamnosyltransferase